MTLSGMDASLFFGVGLNGPVVGGWFGRVTRGVTDNTGSAPLSNRGISTVYRQHDAGDETGIVGGEEGDGGGGVAGLAEAAQG